ncbi:MAG: hypothetical protein QOF33_886 [Thermomicrobiales bacterium]|nr:hypothetical protein [Thermomicrobiales bacterium]
MLRNVLANYLNKVKEREFDVPLSLLLPSMGFYDVHYTHGNVEFGRDFIAKHCDNGVETQYSFQSKAGSIDQSAWRSDIQPQLLEAVLNSLDHPSFDPALPHQLVFVSTGNLSGNAAAGFRKLNAKIEGQYRETPIIFWGANNLIDFLLDSGLTTVHPGSASGFAEYAQFFVLYSRALEGTLTDREIEDYSRLWIDVEVEPLRRLLWCSIESEVLSQQCLERGRLYESIYIHLARLRVLVWLSYQYWASNTRHRRMLMSLFSDGLQRLRGLCTRYVDAFRAVWMEHRDLIRSVSTSMLLTEYPVHCSRLLDVTGLLYFATEAEADRQKLAGFVVDFADREPGARHPIGDRYAVSVVLAVLVLLDQGHVDEVRALVRRLTVWVCDRYQNGIGLGGLEADEKEETQTILGEVFDIFELSNHRSSFLASVLIDLSAFLGDAQFYRAVVNDIKACNIVCEYWQPRDTEGVCRVEAEDVLSYPALGYRDDLSSFYAFDVAEHMGDECGTFAFIDAFGTGAAVALMLLLRDRYFPKLWPELARNYVQAGAMSSRD